MCNPAPRGVVHINDRRREPRADVSWPVQVAGISDFGAGTVINANLCGVLFSTYAELKEGELVVLRIGLDAATAVECAVQIVRGEKQDDINAYGADLRYLSSADRQKLSFALLILREPAASGRSRGVSG